MRDCPDEQSDDGTDSNPDQKEYSYDDGAPSPVARNFAVHVLPYVQDSAWRRLARRVGCRSCRFRWIEPTHAKGRRAELRNGSLIAICLEERHRIEMEEHRNDVPWERLQADVVVPNAGVVVPPRVFDLVLRGGQRFLKLEEALDCAQLWIILRDGEQSANGPRQRIFCGCDLGGISRTHQRIPRSIVPL